MPRLKLLRLPGDVYRPYVTVRASWEGVPQSVIIGGNEYHIYNLKRRQETNNIRDGNTKRDLLIELLQRLGRCPKDAHNMRIPELKALLLEGVAHKEEGEECTLLNAVDVAKS